MSDVRIFSWLCRTSKDTVSDFEQIDYTVTACNTFI